jgi:ankyrin repeat protein
MKQLLKVLFSACIVAASLSGCANGLVVAGKSAQDAFKDRSVVELLAAVVRHNVSEAKHLIADGADINAVGEGGVTPLLWVELNKDTDAMQLLLDLGADPNAYAAERVGNRRFGPPLWMAAGAGQTKIVQILLNRGADPNLVMGSDSPLMTAISGSHLDCAELLFQHGADINYSAAENSPTAFVVAMVVLQYDEALWVLNHGYTHELEKAQRMIVREHRTTRPGQEAMKEQALEIINRLIAAQQKQSDRAART